MKNTSWWKATHLWDSLCAACDGGVSWGMSWVLRVVGKSPYRQRWGKARKPRRLYLTMEALEPRWVPSIYNLAMISPPAGAAEVGPNGAANGVACFSPATIEFSDTISLHDDARELSAKAIWGDGATETLVAAGPSTPEGGMGFRDLNSPDNTHWTLGFVHEYVDEGTYPYTITITDPDGSVTIATSIVVADQRVGAA